MSTATLSVPTISCGHCKSSIEGAIGTLAGIDRVEVTIDAREVEVEFDENAVDLDTIVATIQEQGYDVAL